jgi:hypothetical protein
VEGGVRARTLEPGFASRPDQTMLCETAKLREERK